MRNPWLDIPEDDYAGHMSSPNVGQQAVLARLLGEALAAASPRDFLYPGSGSGNGLEHVDPSVTARVVCVDIHPDYLARLEQRFSGAGFTLEARCEDAGTAVFEDGAFDLIHAALLFEYLDWRHTLPPIVAALRPGGLLSIVMQLPAPDVPAVTETSFVSLRRLETAFAFVNPHEVDELAQGRGLARTLARVEPLPSGKAFAVRHYRKG